MTQPETMTVTDVPEASRFEARDGDELAGYLSYVLTDRTIEFDHTVVDPAFGGRGVGSVLVRTALDAVRSVGGRAVVPTCPFVKSWIDKHPDYADLMVR